MSDLLLCVCGPTGLRMNSVSIQSCLLPIFLRLLQFNAWVHELHVSFISATKEIDDNDENNTACYRFREQ